MTQNEFSFIREACYQKLDAMLNGMIADTNELNKFRDEAQVREQNQNIEKSAEKMESPKADKGNK